MNREEPSNIINDRLPFLGLKVLDLSGILAGPLTGSFFAELGADVIKIENSLTQGDATRQWKLISETPESPYSAYYFSANYGKHTIMMDLTDAESRKTLETLIEQSDIVISNFQKKTAAKLVLLPDDIKNKYPRLIFAQLSAYDFEDSRPGYDLVMQGETGWISMNGTDMDHLSKITVAIIDVIEANQMKEAILIAMWKKLKTGKGSVVHISLFKSGISALVNQASNYLMQNHIPKPIGTLHPNIAPYGDLFTSANDIKFMLAVGSDAQFKKLWFSLTSDDKTYTKFEINSQRLKYRSELHHILQQYFGTINFASLEIIFSDSNVPYCSIKDLQQVFSNPKAMEMVHQDTVDGMNIRSVSHIAFTIS